MQVLRRLPHLASCSLKGCPVATAASYQQEMQALLPSLQIIDGRKTNWSGSQHEAGAGKKGLAAVSNVAKGKATAGNRGVEAMPEARKTEAALHTKQGWQQAAEPGPASKKRRRVAAPSLAAESEDKTEGRSS